MPSPPILDFDNLLAPISGDNPAGDGVPFSVRKKLEEARKEVDPEAFPADDPMRPEKPVPADWAGIEELAQETLARTSKDLLVAARLTEALVKAHGFGGLRDSLQLLRRLVSECWDRLNPPLEEGDPEPRAAPFNWIDDEIRGARFPYTLRCVPLTRSDEGEYGWQHWRESQEATGKVTAEAFEAAVNATPREVIQSAVDDLAVCVQELDCLVQALTEKMGDDAPGLVTVRKAVVDCQALAQQILQRKGPAPVEISESADDVAGNGDTAAASPKSQSGARRRPTNRDEVYAQLAEASAMLLQIEPHSPIAYMVQRAVKLSKLPLPQLMKVLIRNASVLSDLNRDLDLGFEDAEAQSDEE